MRTLFFIWSCQIIGTGSDAKAISVRMFAAASKNEVKLVSCKSSAHTRPCPCRTVHTGVEEGEPFVYVLRKTLCFYRLVPEPFERPAYQEPLDPGDEAVQNHKPYDVTLSVSTSNHRYIRTQRPGRLKTDRRNPR